jgi:hypothetical protein
VSEGGLTVSDWLYAVAFFRKQIGAVDIDARVEEEEVI